MGQYCKKLSGAATHPRGRRVEHSDLRSQFELRPSCSEQGPTRAHTADPSDRRFRCAVARSEVASKTAVVALAMPREAAAIRAPIIARAANDDRKVSMTAYWINTFIDISDEAKLARYVELAGPAMRAAGGRFLARGEPAHVFEGGTALRTTLIEFDTVKAAVDAYNSSAYQEALRALGDGARRDIRIIEGI
jgi:uncharacterized protein (DUF1330 family)